MTTTKARARRATLADFTATPHDTAEEKAKAANALTAFIAAGCPRAKFTKRLYHHLHLHLFGHIAHFDRDGFYETWFRTPGNRAKFLENALAPIVHDPEKGHHIVVGHRGLPEHCWVDVERWVAAWITATGALDRARAEHATDVEQHERAELARLTAKYGTKEAYHDG